MKFQEGGGVTNLRDFFLKQKQAIRSRTREVFRLLHPDDASWRPAPGALCVRDILRHIWVSEEGVRRVALDGDFSYYEARIPRGLGAVLGTPGSIGEEIAEIERVHNQTIAMVSAWPHELLDEERENKALEFRRAVSVILFGINGHEIHHHAQLMTYLRIIGRPVEEPFRKNESREPA
jgi:uncharacterized damage-inducible protein DinB